MINCITVYTDASFCPKTQLSGWAAWVKMDTGTFKYSGILKGSTCCTSAEMMAIANALYLILKNHYIDGYMIVVVTDSSVCKNLINDKKTTKNKTINQALSYINKIKPANCILKINKVKAHSRSDGARSYVNALVDKLARQQMNAARKLKELEQHDNKTT